MPTASPLPAARPNAPALAIEQAIRTFGGRRALDGVSLTVAPGERVALIGPSGAGKSTLLRLAAGLLPADRGSGAIAIHGRTVQRDGRIAREARAIRAEVGFVFQQFNLVGRLSVLTNVLIGRLAQIPLWRSLPHAFTLAERRDAMAALDRVGLADRAAQRASTLSGGQQQRVAIARAICQRARVILADEPIASLDPESSRVVMELLVDLTRTEGATLVVSLHQVEVAMRCCERTVALDAGCIRFDGPSLELDPTILRRIYGGPAGEAEFRSSPGSAIAPGRSADLPTEEVAIPASV
jgi:phosphonate transport system ATP-binding protein